MIELNELQALNAKGLFNGLDKVRFGDATPSLASVNVGMPAGILATLSSAVVENILAKRTADEALGGRTKLLDWGDEKYFLPFVEKAGKTTPYADNGTPLNASLNVSFNERGHYRFSAGFVYGNLQAEQYSKAKINYADTLLRSATEAIAVELNRTAFEGALLSGSLICYGLLNDPTLANYTTSSKTFEAMTWEEVMAFFAGAIVKLVQNTGNNINGLSNIRCVIASTSFAQLQAKYTSLGISVFENLQKLYPNMQFVPAVELDKAVTDTNAVYFIGDDNLGGIGKTTDLGYSELALMGNVVQEHNGYSQVVSAGTSGALVYKPSYVVRYSGI